MLVLIVDDNERNRRLARDLLLGAGFETLEAATGADAFSLAVEHAPDVILMDLRLPDIDGAEVALKLEVEPRTAEIPVVALSALPLEGSGEWLKAAGFVGWIEKPIRVGRFAEDVRRLASRARK